MTASQAQQCINGYCRVAGLGTRGLVAVRIVFEGYLRRLERKADEPVSKGLGRLTKSLSKTFELPKLRSSDSVTAASTGFSSPESDTFTESTRLQSETTLMNSWGHRFAGTGHRVDVLSVALLDTEGQRLADETKTIEAWSQAYYLELLVRYTPDDGALHSSEATHLLPIIRQWADAPLTHKNIPEYLAVGKKWCLSLENPSCIIPERPLATMSLNADSVDGTKHASSISASVYGYSAMFDVPHNWMPTPAISAVAHLFYTSLPPTLQQKQKTENSWSRRWEADVQRISNAFQNLLAINRRCVVDGVFFPEDEINSLCTSAEVLCLPAEINSMTDERYSWWDKIIQSTRESHQFCRVLSYNLLADAYTKEGMLYEHLTHNASLKQLSMGYRGGYLIHDIERASSRHGISLLQEVDKWFAKWWLVHCTPACSWFHFPKAGRVPEGSAIGLYQPWSPVRAKSVEIRKAIKEHWQEFLDHCQFDNSKPHGALVLTRALGDAIAVSGSVLASVRAVDLADAANSLTSSNISSAWSGQRGMHSLTDFGSSACLPKFVEAGEEWTCPPAAEELSAHICKGVIAFSTHLFFHSTGDSVRAVQSWMMLREIKQQAETAVKDMFLQQEKIGKCSKSCTLMVVVGGDFNSDPKSLGHRLISQGTADLDSNFCLQTPQCTEKSENGSDKQERIEGNSITMESIEYLKKFRALDGVPTNTTATTGTIWKEIDNVCAIGSVSIQSPCGFKLCKVSGSPHSTTRVEGFVDTLDYVFVNWCTFDGEQIKWKDPAKYSHLPYDAQNGNGPEQESSCHYLPKSNHPSDHIPIVVDIEHEPVD